MVRPPPTPAAEPGSLGRAVAFVLAATISLFALPARALGPGERFPPIELKAWSGGGMPIAELRGRVVLLDFWASWCVLCAEALPRLDRLARRFGGEGCLSVLAASIDEDPAAADAFAEKHLAGTPITALRDPGGAALARLGATSLPALYLIAPDGTVARVESGADPGSFERLAADVERLLGQCERGASSAAVEAREVLRNGP